ncbi:hypothetical protein KTAU_25630 [Thermogemmatispora aurantia]|uniref:Aminoacyl-transfer RNA synthetases class-II family profile domain-containing protein n=1 Tax=Thermogemmatispora aurantia TaxID=2045279 RepID=A0A5J4KCZ5_9CHLR|nr:hypothetical protein [Thermogemmatispora aurantia]GER83926.1 hypothetical protein KTAU_25630 [Thermogemmatispora aurantia]
MQLTKEERDRLRKALAEAELLNADEEWDSLDLVSALVVTEYELGIVLDEAELGPGDLSGVAALEAAIERYGRRLAVQARLRLDVEPPPDQAQEEGVLPQSRRQIEYRLALACPEARVAVSRGRQLSVFSSASDPGSLPVSEAMARVLSQGDVFSAGPTPSSFPGGAVQGSEDATRLRGGEAGAVIARIEREVQAFVIQWGGTLWAPASPLISVDQLRHLGYYDAHPEQIIHLDEYTALLPAACLNSYPLLDADDVVLGTHLATVFRREPHYDSAVGRMPAFTCREVLWCASQTWEERFTSEVELLLTGLAADLGIKGRWVAAHDPFFLGGGKAGHKREFRGSVAGKELALASINRHGDHFIVRGYGRPGRVTGCVGLGLERWVLAALYRGEERACES